MKKTFKILLILLIGGLFLSCPVFFERQAKAASSANPPSIAEIHPRTNSTNGKVNPSLGDILSGIFQRTNDPALANLDSVNLLLLKILGYAFNFAGIVAFVMVLWAARSFLNAYGSDEAATMGKKTLIWAFVGLCVIITSKALLIWIYKHLAN